MASLAVGLCVLWIVRSLDGPREGDSPLPHLVSLPIALLLPAVSVAAALVGCQSWRAAGSPAWLAALLIAALGAQALTLGLFVRIVAGLFGA